MRIRTAVELFSLVGVVTTALFCSGVAGADDDPGHRFGLTPGIGGGIAGIVHPGPLPGFVGYTDLSGEIFGEIRPWGAFLRADFLSSGDAGRWTAWSFTGGTQYRLFGTTKRTAFFLRGGLVYERWLGNNQGCPVPFVAPSSCNLLGTGTGFTGTPAPTPFSVNTNLVGVSLGARVEIPISTAYIALGATFVPSAAIDASNPTSVFALRFDLELGFRDVRKNTDPSTGGDDPHEQRRHR